MFLKDYEPTPVKNTKTVTMICNNCNNESEHGVFEEPKGLIIGFPLAKKPWLSMKNYYLLCPICKKGGKKINKEQVKSLKI